MIGVHGSIGCTERPHSHSGDPMGTGMGRDKRSSTIRQKEVCRTAKPRRIEHAPSIRFLTRSPISFIHAFTLSRSRGSGHVADLSVDCSSSFMYALSKSASNVATGRGGCGIGDAALGRGDGALERGVTGERSPDAIEVAIEVKSGGSRDGRRRAS